MEKRLIIQRSSDRARFVTLLAALIMLGAGSKEVAAADCLEQPNVREADGHWYYRIDGLSHQKCWYVKRESQSAGSSLPEPAFTLASVPSSIASILMGRKSSASTGAQQDVATTAATSEPSTDTTAPKKSNSPTHRRRWALNERTGSGLRFQKQQLEHVDQQHDLDPVQREKLFEDFLRWSTRRE